VIGWGLASFVYGNGFAGGVKKKASGGRLLRLGCRTVWDFECYP
jgi:hypothetical protein